MYLFFITQLRIKSYINLRSLLKNRRFLEIRQVEVIKTIQFPILYVYFIVYFICYFIDLS